jgi:hypothetical protein
MEVRPRFDYGQAPHKLEITDDGFVFSADGMELTLNPVGERDVSLGDQGLTVERLGDDIRITRTLREGEIGRVVLESMGGQPRRIPPTELEQLSVDTAACWRGWVGHSTYRGRWREMVARSAMTLKLMTYAPSGALVAAPTAGLPELTGGAELGLPLHLGALRLILGVCAAGAGLCGGSRRLRALAARPRRGMQGPRRPSAEDHVPGGRLFGPE